MSTVTGRIVGKGSGRGIADLLVEVFDVKLSGERSRIDPAANLQGHRRIGSGWTDESGRFSIDTDGGEGPKNGKGRAVTPPVNLLIAISGPESADGDTKPLYVSREVRRGAAKTETYLIRIPEADLEKAGVQLPGTPDDEVETAAVAAKRLLALSKRSVNLAQAEQAALKVKVDSTRSTAKAFDADFRPALQRRLSSATPSATSTFVPNGGSITGAHRQMVASDLSAVVNTGGSRTSTRARFALTAEQLRALRDKLGPNQTIAAEDLGVILRMRGPDMGGTSYSASSPLETLCREISERERSVADALDGKPAADPTPAPVAPSDSTDVAGNGVERIESTDIPRYLARLVDTMTSPEESVLAGLEPKATQGTLAAQLENLALKPSPAETTAFYDFHNLQVAFRHVWQEALDEGVLSLAEAAYDEIVNLGGAPNPSSHIDPVRALIKDGEIVQRSMKREIAMQRDQPSAALLKVPGNVWPGAGLLDGLFVSDGVSKPTETLPDLLAELNQRLQEPYAFTTFAANRHERSVNFGTLVTYRQTWQPLLYQAGRLAKTITLAPKEVQKYTKTIKRHRKRVVKEVENHLQIHKQESSQTSRVEQDIINKANVKTTFGLSSEATAKDPTGMAGTTTKTSFEREAGQVSESVKKAFHESVIKASQEFKDEFNVEITTEESEDFESVESGELCNPNDELAVTFLFYDLQRRYRVWEEIFRITPLVMVAQEMPAPHEINEAWLVSHDWILRRVLLDDSFVPALDYLSERVVGDRVAIDEMRTNITQQRLLIADLKRELRVVRSRIATYRNMLEQSLLQTAAKRSGGGGGLFSRIPIVGDAVGLAHDAVEAVGDFINPDIPSVGDSRLDALKETIQRTVDEERDMLMRIEREVTALNALTETFAKALAENYNHRTQILRLRTHIKQNILYYMQAIWNHEPPDQRYLRLHEVPVPTFNDRRRYRFASLEPVPGAMNGFAHRTLELDANPASLVYEAEVLTDFSLRETKPLAQVADLDNLLGYFGNYMIFALKESNPLTDFMMEPYVLRGFNELTDPDDLGNWTLHQFVDYVTCLKEKLTADDFETIRPTLKEQYARLIKSPHRSGEEVIVPTGSLFIEALPATSSLLERFKTLHRATDLKLAQERLRHDAIESLRLVDRLLNSEREDPDIDKKVIIEGARPNPSVPVDDPS